MNHSLITADRRTHTKILAVALLAALVVIGVGLTARLTESESSVVTASSASVASASNSSRQALFTGRETTGLH